MEFKVNTLSASEKEIEISLDASEFNVELERELVKLRKNVRLDGFRKGKIPKHLYEKMFGASLDEEASENIANRIFWDVAKSEDFHLRDKPKMTKLDFNKQTGFSFTVQFEVYPEFELKGYKGLSIKSPGFRVTDKIVDGFIESQLKRSSTEESAETVEDKNYRLIVDYTHSNTLHNEEKAFSHNDFPIDLSADGIDPELPALFFGKTVGDEVKYVIHDKAHDHDHHHEEGHEHHHSDVEYLFKIAEIRKIVLPELNDDFVKTYTNDKIDNVEDWKKDIHRMLDEYHTNQTKESVELSITDVVMENNDFKLGAAMVEDALKHMIKSEKEQAKKQNKKVKSDDKLREELLPRAENYLKWVLIKNKIIEAEAIVVSDQTVYSVAKTVMKKYGITLSQASELVRSNESLNDDLENKELFRFLMQNNSIKLEFPEGDEEDFVFVDEVILEEELTLEEDPSDVSSNVEDVEVISETANDGVVEENKEL